MPPVDPPAWDEEPDSTPFPPLYAVLSDGKDTMLVPISLFPFNGGYVMVVHAKQAAPDNPIGFPHPHTDEHSE